MADIINIMKALGQVNRLRILNLLNQQKLCVCEMQNIMNQSQSNISRHLNVLKQSGLISSEKDSLYIYYYLNRKNIEEYPFISTILTYELRDADFCQEDNERLDIYQESEINCDDLKESNLFEALEY